MLLPKLFIVFTLFHALTLLPFKTISQAQAYAEMIEEYPDSDNDNWLNPDFTTWYKQSKPSFTTRVLQKLGFRKTLSWSEDVFKKILVDVLEQREILGFTERFVVRIVVEPSSRMYIVGDLLGAFHSLIRILDNLKFNKIIDDNFKLINKNTTLVFVGNVIDGSPFILETLTVVLRVLQENPNQVFYIKGQHEDKQYWYDHGLKQELQLRIKHESQERIPLERLINRFFQTLPLALYTQLSTDMGILRISPSGRDAEELNEQYFDQFFQQPLSLGNVDIYQIKYRDKIDKTPPIQVIIKSAETLRSAHPSQGLDFLAPDRGAPAWSVFSSPTRMNRTLREFFYDALAILHFGTTFNTSTIQLFHQDVREKTGFIAATTYNLITGKNLEETSAVVAAQPLVITPKKEESSSLNALTLGSTLDVSKGVSIMGQRVKQGMFACLNNFNEQHKSTIKLVVLDDEYTPDKTRQNVEQFMRDGINLIVCPVGSPTVQSLLDFIKQHKIFVFFPITGAPILRTPELSSMVHFRASYAREAEGLIKYLFKNFPLKSVALFYQNDAFGLGALEASRKELSKLGITAITEIPYPHNSLDFKDIIKKITTLQVDAFGFFATSIATRELIKQVGTEFFSSKKLFGLSDLGEDIAKKFFKEQGLQCFIAQAVPNPQTSQLDIVKEYREIARKNNVPLDVFSLEAYIATSLTLDILQKTDGTFTPESIATVVSQIKNYNFKGLILNYNPANHELADLLWIDTGTNDWVSITKEQQATIPATPTVLAPVVSESPPQAQSTSDNIVLGSSLNLRKGASAQAKQLKAGYSACINEINKMGGINGRLIEFVALDDEYDPNKSLENIQGMRQRGINIFVGVSGSANLLKSMDLMKEAKILVLFPITGAPIFHQEDIKGVVHWRASYKKEGAALVEYILKQEPPITSMVLFYQNDPFGKGALEGAQEILKNTSIKVHEIPYERGSADFQEQVAKLKDISFDAIGFFSTAIAAKEFIRSATPSLFFKKRLFGVSDVGEDVFKTFLKEQGLTIISLHSVPNPETSDLEIVKEYREVMQKNKEPIDPFSLEAYITMSITSDILKKITGPISIESMLNIIQSFKNYNYKGLNLTFNANKRELADNVWLDTGNNSWIQL